MIFTPKYALFLNPDFLNGKSGINRSLKKQAANATCRSAQAHHESE